MEEILLLRYAEIHLKGKNRGYFEKVLKNNIKEKISVFGAKLDATAGRYIISGYKAKDKNKVINILKSTPGIYSLSPAIVVENDIKSIIDVAVNLMSEKTCTFRVSVNRADKKFPVPSMKFAGEVGHFCLEKNKNLTVDLHNFDINLNIDIRENGKTYVFFDEIMGVSGMPVGTAGKGTLLLSGGIDSPVAGFMMAKRGLKIVALHFESFPYTSVQAKEKALELAKILSKYNGRTEVYVANIAKIQDAIHNNCHEDYMITIVRRFMLRIAEKLSDKINSSCIVTGESLAQVASQTIESMTVIGDAMKSNLPLLKPLVGFDKLETVEIAKKIGSFDISIRPYDDCCTVYLPKNPVIKPKLDKVLKEESKLNVEELIQECFSSIEKIVIE